MKICQRNPPYKEMKKENIIISLDAENAFDKMQHSVMLKVWERSGIQNIWIANSQHKMKWRDIQRNSTKIRNKTKLSYLFIAIQYSTQNFS